MDHDYLTWLIHGESKVGKTTLASTSPKPMLVLDAERGGMRFVPGKKINWDLDQPLDLEGESDVIVRVKVKSMSDIDRVYRYLNEQDHPFRSVWFDSYTEIQSRLKREISATGILDQSDWGQILIKLEDLVVNFCELSEHPNHPIQHVGIITGTRFKDGKFRPFMQGQIVTKLPYSVDICGFLFVQKDEEGNLRRGLRIRGNDIHDVGERVHCDELDNVVWDPDIQEIYETVFSGESE